MALREATDSVVTAAMEASAGTPHSRREMAEKEATEALAEQVLVAREEMVGTPRIVVEWGRTAATGEKAVPASVVPGGTVPKAATDTARQAPVERGAPQGPPDQVLAATADQR